MGIRGGVRKRPRAEAMGPGVQLCVHLYEGTRAARSRIAHIRDKTNNIIAVILW